LQFRKSYLTKFDVSYGAAKCKFWIKNNFINRTVFDRIEIKLRDGVTTTGYDWE